MPFSIPGLFPLPRRRLWALALGGPLSAMHSEPFDRLPSRYSPEQCRKLLAEWWTVSDQSSARVTCHWLRTAGHTVEARALLGADDGSPQASFVRRNREEIARAGLMAWDLGRVVPVARWSQTAGYLSEEEAWAWIEADAALLQAAYPSWEAYGNGWRLGYAFWNHGREPDTLFEQPLFDLLKSPSSPWTRLAWATKL